MHVKVHKSPPKVHQVNVAHETTFPWDVWHRQFGHIGYHGLQWMLDANLVNGFNIDQDSPKPDCQSCTECKLAKKPFPKKAQTRATRPGQRTCFDLWGKSCVTSLHRNQYFIMIIDNNSWYVTVEPLKKKNEASQHVKDHLTYLENHGKKPESIRFDERKEFDNLDLHDWC